MKGDPRTRHAIAVEAANLMYREGVTQYFDAKRIAARRVLGARAKQARYRAEDLPSNGEIRAALLTLVSRSEGAEREARLFAMRVLALEVMRALVDWHPRLIGSVWSGHARRGSDVDVHVFGDLDALTRELTRLGWAFFPEEVLIRVPDGFRVYHHLHVTDRQVPVELSVYGAHERHQVTRSSVDGSPIDRVSAARLEAKLREEHEAAFVAWCATGVVDFVEGPRRGAFDALLTDDAT
jgi:hypothetical protein